MLRGAKENATRMATLGFEVYRFQLVAYSISGALCGLAGFLLANANDFVSPAYMSWQRSGELIIMVLLGGIQTLAGPIVGASVFATVLPRIGPRAPNIASTRRSASAMPLPASRM